MRLLLTGVRTLTVPVRLKAGDEVWVREAWRGWNCCGPDELKDSLNATMAMVNNALKSITDPALTSTKEYKAAIKSFVPQTAPSGWAEIDYRVDGKRVRINGLTLTQTDDARVIGQIDVGVSSDPWRSASLMPEWASRFKLKVQSARKLGARSFRVTFAPETDKGRGVYRKYKVTRTDGSSRKGKKHAECSYYVLDLQHDEFARPALEAYAKACRKQFPDLAADIDDLLSVTPCGCRAVAECMHFNSPQNLHEAMVEKLS